MKWILSQATDGLHHWLLQVENGSKSLIFNLHRLSLRLMGASKRLFFLQVRGFLQKKILLRSEYGVVIGETAFTDKPSPTSLLFNGRKLFYRTEGNQLLLLNNEKQLIGETEVAALAMTNRYEFYSLLFSLAWFLTADTLAENNSIVSISA